MRMRQEELESSSESVNQSEDFDDDDDGRFDVVRLPPLSMPSPISPRGSLVVDVGKELKEEVVVVLALCSDYEDQLRVSWLYHEGLEKTRGGAEHSTRLARPDSLVVGNSEDYMKN
jgi:hypothetical protein